MAGALAGRQAQLLAHQEMDQEEEAYQPPAMLPVAVLVMLELAAVELGAAAVPAAKPMGTTSKFHLWVVPEEGVDYFTLLHRKSAVAVGLEAGLC